MGHAGDEGLDGAGTRVELELTERGPERRRWLTPLTVALAFALGSMAWILWSDWGIRQIPMAESARDAIESVKGALYAAACGVILYVVLGRLERERRQVERREKRYRALIEAQSDLILRWLPDTTLTFVNEPYRKAFQREGKRLEGRKWIDHIPEERRGAVRRLLTTLGTLAPGASPIRDTGPSICADGVVRWHEWTDTPVFDEAGRLVEVQSFGRDVTDRVLAERQRAEATERLRLVSEVSTNGFYEWDVATDRVWRSEGYQRYIGEGGEDPSVTTWESRVHPEDLGRVRRGLQIAIEGRAQVWTDEFRWRRWDGVWATVEDRALIVRDQRGQALRLVGAFQDVTDRRREQAALRETEQRLRLALDGTGVVVWEGDPQTASFTHVSDGAERLLGFAAREWLEPDFWKERVHPEDVERVVTTCAERSARGENHRLEYRMIAKDGREVWVDDIVLVEMENGKPVASRGVLIDITERKEAERALRASREQLAEVLEHAGIVAWEADPRTLRLTSVSGSAERMLGFAASEWTTEGFWMARVHPEDRERAVELCVSATGRGEDHRFEYRMARADGRMAWIDDVAQVVKKDGRVVGLRGVMIDVTARKEAELGRAEMDRRWRDLVEHAPAPIWVNQDRRFVYLNHAATRMFGAASREELLGRDILERVHPSCHEQVKSRGARMYAGEKVGPAEQIWTRLDGEQLEIEVSPSVTFFNGRPAIQVAAQDLTSRNRTQRELRESRAFIERVAQTTPDILYVFDLLEGRSLFTNASVERVLGFTLGEIESLGSKTLAALVHTEDAGVVRAHHARFSDCGDDEVREVEYRIRTRDGGWRWLRSRDMVFARDGGGRATQIIGAATDVTERRRAESRQTLMMRELDHRVKNNLSTVLALIESTARTTEGVAAYRDALRGRIESLTAAHALLARSGWQGASVQDVARTAVAPFAPRGRNCLSVTGGEVVVAPPLATPLCMAMHELATNAAKHGALSNGEGRVSVAARVERDEQGRSTLVVEWSESGGPTVRPAERRGLGLSLIEGLVRHEMGGRLESGFEPEGARWRMWLPLDRGRTAGGEAEGAEFDGALGPLPSTA